MFITVKILQGKECSINVSTSTSVSAVKQQVAKELSIPVQHQRLVFKGKTLSDSLTLCDYNIVEGNRLHLFVLKEAVPSTPESSQAEERILWEKMEGFLSKHFTPHDTQTVLKEFKKDFEATYGNLSLDDIERLAKYSMHMENGFCSESDLTNSL